MQRHIDTLTRLITLARRDDLVAVGPCLTHARIAATLAAVETRCECADMTLSRLTAALGATAAAVLLSGCKTGLDLEVFTSDIVAASGGEAGLAARAILSVQAPSDDKCRDMAPQIEAALRTGFPDASFDGCARRDLDTVARFKIALPIVTTADDLPAALALMTRPMNGGHGIVIKADMARVDAVIDAMPDEATTLLTGKPDPQITATVSNDLEGIATLTAQGVFVADEPFQLPKEFTIQRRDSLRITLSDVGNAALWNGGSLIGHLKE